MEKLICDIKIYEKDGKSKKALKAGVIMGKNQDELNMLSKILLGLLLKQVRSQTAGI